MKLTLLFFAALSLGASTLATVPVSPNATFLEDSPLDVCFPGLSCNFSPTIVDLASLGLAPGDSIELQASGWLCPFDTADCTRYDAASRVLGVFSDASGFVQSSAPPFVTGPTYIGGVQTDVPQDFLLPIEVVDIPGPATSLGFGILDSAFGDNQGRIEVTISEVPEPRLWILVGLAIVFMAFFRTAWGQR